MMVRKCVMRTRGKRCGSQEGVVWGLISQGSFGSPAGVVQRADPALVTKGLFMRWILTEPLICVRLRPPAL